MQTQLAENHYGKSRVRLLKVTRRPESNDVHDWTLGVYLTGDFNRCYVEGDNTGIMATDTMKNTVYAVARTSTAQTMEAFALELADFLAARNPQVASIRITVEEKMWIRLKAEGPDGEKQGKKAHPYAFLQRGPDAATASVVLAPGTAPAITAGVRGLVLLKTADSSFTGFTRDELTTLPEASDRLLGTEATIDWVYDVVPEDPATLRAAVMDTLLSTFSNHHSLSVQHTLYAMAEATLAAHPQLAELTLTMPNRHNIPANLLSLGLSNPNTIFIPQDEPHGQIHARIVRNAG